MKQLRRRLFERAQERNDPFGRTSPQSRFLAMISRPNQRSRKAGIDGPTQCLESFLSGLPAPYKRSPRSLVERAEAMATRIRPLGGRSGGPAPPAGANSRAHA